MANFALRLKELREKVGLTQEALGERAGVHKLTVAKLEQGIREPGWNTVLALARALGVDCRAFTQEPANPDKSPTPRGRPAKTKKESPAEKRGRRAKRKGYRDMPGT